jgi:hypothetical protein
MTTQDQLPTTSQKSDAEIARSVDDFGECRATMAQDELSTTSQKSEEGIVRLFVDL